MKKIFMASIALTTFALAFALFQMTSCKKATAQTPSTPATYPIQGLWVGTYTIDGQAALGQQYFSFVIKPDGSIINDTKYNNQQNLALGNWTLSGTTLSCSFTNMYGQASNFGVSETCTATWDNSGKLTAGIWKNVAPLSGSGTFVLTRIN
ncbi:MAG: hypothetical protein WDM90_19700 [Ferruginibacter sp.]